MSIRAYYVEEIKTKTPDTFNVWYDTEVVEWLEENTQFFKLLNDDCYGVTEVEVEDLERLLKEVEMSEEVRKAFEEDIRDAKEAGKRYVTYFCF